ncbi:MAG: HAMP domain-containing protein [Methanomicrobiales archaeon]|nr:HAMP domain-containing protein [Methanomicrobiales archaeon]
MIKVSILLKLMVLMVVLTLVPLGILGVLSVQDEKALGMNAARDAQIMGEQAIADSTLALNTIGEQVIQQKAVDVARQIEVYLIDHPDVTIRELQMDPFFSQLAVQPVGETGYTALTDVNTLICYFHKNPKIVNTDLHNLSAALPGFWGVMSKSQGGIPVKGYYDWKEPDGSFRQKYMYIAIVNTTTGDDIRLSVAATTYIDEFSRPMVATSHKINSSVQETTAKIKTATESISTQNNILILTLGTMVVVLICAFLFARMITGPIIQLTRIAEKVSLGDLTQEIDVKTGDEIEDLAVSFRRMINAFKVMERLNREDQEEEDSP